MKRNYCTSTDGNDFSKFRARRITGWNSRGRLFDPIARNLQSRVLSVHGTRLRHTVPLLHLHLHHHTHWILPSLSPSESHPWPSPLPLGNPESSNSAMRYVDAFLVDFSRSTVLNVSFRFDCVEPPCQPLVSTAGTMFPMLSTPWSTLRTSATRTRFVLKGGTQSIVG